MLDRGTETIAQKHDAWNFYPFGFVFEAFSRNKIRFPPGVRASRPGSIEVVIHLG
jgi:hypothetical protein